jgi:NAD(P)-dependent dehydrogenase (short-subunit alcohol dehydrogenase family)
VDLVVITGIGGMGMACARRIGSGRQLLIADYVEERLTAAARQLIDDGFLVETQQVDVANPGSVKALAERAASLGSFRTLVHTAGLSPTMADAGRIYAVDLIGTILMMDAFLPLASSGATAIMIASLAGHLARLAPELERKLAQDPRAALEAAIPSFPTDPAEAYTLSKRANILRVEAQALAWGARGARIVSISPGTISTEMGRAEAKAHPLMSKMREMSPVPRLGTAEDIAMAAEWIASPSASFITGCDLKVDGGVAAAMRNLNPAIFSPDS